MYFTHFCVCYCYNNLCCYEDFRTYGNAKEEYIRDETELNPNAKDSILQFLLSFSCCFYFMLE